MEVIKKFIESIRTREYEVLSDEGWVDIEYSLKTIPYDVWEIITEHYEMKCADDHILFDDKLNKVFAKDLKVGQYLYSKTGPEKVINVRDLKFQDNMYDLQLPKGSTHRFFTNNLLSSNTTLMTIYSLWLTCFEADKTVMIVANKEATAINILRRVRMAYEYLPNWLKPGVKQWGKTEVVFANDSRITISSTSSSSSRGETANCVDGDSIVTLKDKNTQEVFDMSMKDLAETLEKDGTILNVNLVDDEDD